MKIIVTTPKRKVEVHFSQKFNYVSDIKSVIELVIKQSVKS